MENYMSRATTESYEDRIEYTHTLIAGSITLPQLTEICMDMTTKEFDQFENSVIILDDTGNHDGKYELVESLLED
jgi:hypothetical protein